MQSKDEAQETEVSFKVKSPRDIRKYFNIPEPYHCRCCAHHPHNIEQEKLRKKRIREEKSPQPIKRERFSRSISPPNITLEEEKKIIEKGLGREWTGW